MGRQQHGNDPRNDLRMDRAVSLAARKLGDGVQSIVLAAKTKETGNSSSSSNNNNNGAWKEELLELLGENSSGGSSGGSSARPSTSTTTLSDEDDTIQQQRQPPAETPQTPDIDILLKNSRQCKTFVERCVEHELPPNLIHCLRLLRVLELQHASEHNNSKDHQDESSSAAATTTTPPEHLQPAAAKATRKVSRLLCQLCQTSVVGEQLKPHLFGLLALSGASYPWSGIHVAKAASDVIIELAQHCLTRPLIRIMQDRKMIIHMTDDVKDLAGLSSEADLAAVATSSSSSPPSSSVPLGLSGAEAEQAGLWVIALQTIVKLVSCSVQLHNMTDLVQDFHAAGGYEVLQYAIENSTGTHGRELMELLPQLISCPVAEEIQDEDDIKHEKLAVNGHIFDLQEEFLARSNPLLMEYASLHDGDHPDFSETKCLEELAALSLKTAGRLRLQERTEGEFQFDISSELLSATLQIFSDHPRNYELVEERQHILSIYLLAFPCYRDEDLKSFILKTLEFVLTGVGVADEVTPVNACVEIFFALSHTLLQGEDALDESVQNKQALLVLLGKDASLMGSTLEKLLQFDQRVAPLMVESGILTTNLDSLLSLINEHTSKDKSDEKATPNQTPQDEIFQIVCRVLKLLVSHQPVNFTCTAATPLEARESTNLHTLLNTATKRLGVEAAREAAAVFESYMSSFASLDSLNNDMTFVLKMVDNLSSFSVRAKTNEETIGVLNRQAVLLSMLRSVLEARSLARESFRYCGGLRRVLTLLLAWKDCVGDVADPEVSGALVRLIQTSVGLLDSAIGIKSKSPISNDEASMLILPADVLVDPISSRISSRSPAAQNRSFLRQQAYYLELASVVAGTGILKTEKADSVAELALSHVDPSLIPLKDATDCAAVRNPDAVRFALGIALFLPNTEAGKEIATLTMDKILSLCEPEKSASTRPQISSCGLCFSLTNPKEFGPVLRDLEHPHHFHFAQILVSIASDRMSYSDFVGLLHCMAGPLLTVGNTSDGSIRLPIISSSIKKRTAASLMASGAWSEEFQRREGELCKKLTYICQIARESDAAPRIRLGGDSINTIAVLMHKVRIEDRLRAVAEQGRLKFLEIERIDSSAAKTNAINEVSSADPAAGTPSEGVWAPVSGSGFSYSMWLRHENKPGSSGNLYLFDVSNPSSSLSEGQSLSAFLSVWYDMQHQRFNAISHANNRGEPVCFPVCPLLPNIWHHILVTYTPSKRTMMSRKSALCIYVDGRPLEAEVKVDTIILPPNSRIIIGAPNPAFAVSGIVRGVIPVWELGPFLLLSAVLLDYDAVAIYSYGERFPGLLWGDRPQRLSLAATATATFVMLSNAGETGSLASALRRRDILKLERAGYSVLGHNETDDLSNMCLLCNIPPECVVFGFQPGTSTCRFQGVSRPLSSERLVNLARLSFANEEVSTDAIVYGKGILIAPLSFAENLQWVGGPEVLMPLVNAANSSRSLALALEIIREGSRSHRPNLEMLQAEGGYRVLGVLLQEKPAVDETCLDQCLAFAIHGFEPGESASDPGKSSRWVLSDLDAMNHLLLNHKVWDLRKYGPEVPLRLLSALNKLVDHRAMHRAFNARRLHQLGIVRWVLHLMIEACELFLAGDQNTKNPAVWSFEPPLVTDVSVGGDPGSPFLLECKNLLRRVLTFMLTPSDLQALAEASIHTAFISAAESKPEPQTMTMDEGVENNTSEKDERMLSSSTMRLHLVRLLEELIVDGVNEIVAAVPTPSGKQMDKGGQKEKIFQPHSGGVASPGQPYFTIPSRRGLSVDGLEHPKHQQAQAFLSAFSSFLTPVWFATLLEGCREEASCSAIVRLMILLLQGSSTFEAAFWSAGGFMPFILSIPKYSTCPGIAIAMLSQLLNVPILHLHALPSLDPDQLCELFEAEGDRDEAMPEDVSTDPSNGIFALVAECLGRNMKLINAGNEAASRATDTNKAIVQLLLHRLDTSVPFRNYCGMPSFLEPLSQALCMVYDDKSTQATLGRSKRQPSLVDVPKGLTPTERYIGGPNDPISGPMGLVRLLRRVIRQLVKDAPLAAMPVRTIFQAFPIHATAQQVEAFHLVVLEQCCRVMDKVMEEGGAVAIANCVGVCSVLLEQMVMGYFTSEAALQTLKAVSSILNKLVKFETSAMHTLANAEHTLLTMDAAHLAKLVAGTALRVSLAGVTSRGTYRGDEDLQSEVLQILDTNIDDFLLIPSQDRRSGRKIPTGKFLQPSPNSKTFSLWQSASIMRCNQVNEILYPDIGSCEHPEAATIAPLLVVLHRLLCEGREDVRSLTISIFVVLLEHRPNLMSELLVAEIPKGDQVEKIDVVNRGGFRALLVAQEVSGTSGADGSHQSVKKRYSSFFSWFDRNQYQVQLVFDVIQEMSLQYFPALPRAYSLQCEAIEEEQKRMLIKITAEDSDRTVIGGLEREELARQCNDRTAEYHNRWRRQGFDNLAYGAMKLKILMRRMKGSYSLWEGGLQWNDEKLVLQKRLVAIENGDAHNLDGPVELVKRWKLDLTEGYERQRRRLLPNYEFHGLYNLDESAEDENTRDTRERLGNSTAADEDNNDVVDVEATAALLKDLNLKRSHRNEDEIDSDFEEAAEFDDATVGTAVTTASSTDGASMTTSGETALATNPSGIPENGVTKGPFDAGQLEEDETAQGNEDSYELVTGLLRKGDWPLKSYNVRRCTGLEVTKALFLVCQDNVYVIDGFEQTDGDKITRVEREQSTFYVSLRSKGANVSSSDEKGDRNVRRQQSRSQSQSDSAGEVIHQHRSQRILFRELYAVYRRRYQLQQSGLEFYDVNKNATLIAFETNEEREEVLSKVLSSNTFHPDSIFSIYGSSTSFSRIMSNMKAKIISQWVNGKMTNFDFLMHINNLAGRSFNDLTQYPVFPWIIADYESENIDLNDPKLYRDLSKPMGAIGEERARQFKERYEALESTYFGEDDPPPFHYGTHFSSAAYTLYYLMRLEPFSRLALALQGGRFDVADRLFHDVGRSWRSASSENLQDVRELIPEFFYLPDFLVNTNEFDFGETQRGKLVHDVTLPKWAKGDPKRFVRINRMALESPYVSQHLHLWVDLVFGYKQRSVEDLNVFVHVTYEGEVELESMTDPVQLASTIAQIQNFGQTPTKIERKPFPQRISVELLKDGTIDFGALSYLSLLTPPLCVRGAPHRIKLLLLTTEACKLGLSGQTDRTVSDLCLFKGQPIGVGRLCTLLVKPRKYCRFGGSNNGLSIHTAAVSTRYREVNKLVSIHDGLHRAPISSAKASVNGDWIVTGCVDSTIRVWKYEGNRLKLCASFCGCGGFQVTCLDISSEFSVIVSGSDRGTVLVWDVRSLTFIRHLPHEHDGPVLSISVNSTTGNILTLVGPHLSLFDINGNLLARQKTFATSPTCGVATDCPEWMEEGIVAVTGHVSGDVCLWSLDHDNAVLVMRYELEGNPHMHSISALRVAGAEHQDHLLVGDSSGKMSVWKVIQLENLDAEELSIITNELVAEQAPIKGI